jgi:RNA polymerase sigma factor (sigma-70 family)
VPTLNPPPPDREDPRDSEMLEGLARARTRGDFAEERRFTGELIAGWQPRVEALVRFRGFDGHDMGDIVSRWSERMVKALANRTSFDGPFGAVVMQNANWTCNDYLDQAHLKHEYLTGEPWTAHEDTAEAGGDEISEVQTAVDAALASLSEREQVIIDGIYRYGKKRKQVAADLRMSEGAVRTALCRAMGKVRRRLRDAGVTNRGRPPV